MSIDGSRLPSSCRASSFCSATILNWFRCQQGGYARVDAKSKERSQCRLFARLVLHCCLIAGSSAHGFTSSWGHNIWDSYIFSSRLKNGEGLQRRRHGFQPRLFQTGRRPQWNRFRTEESSPSTQMDPSTLYPPVFFFCLLAILNSGRVSLRSWCVFIY